MPRVIDPSDLDNAVQLYLSGKTVKQAAAQFGVGASTLSRELHRRGVETGRRGTWRDLPAGEIAQDYAAGLSELAIANKYKAERGAVRRVLLDLGVQPRGRSEAGLVRAAQMTPEARRAQATAAHNASRGRKAAWDERCRVASGRERNPPELSVHERPFAGWLAERDIPYRREVAVGPYNLDFAVGSVAVEILGGEWHAYKARHAHRTPYILDQRWAIAFVWSTANCPMTSSAADYVVAFANEVTRNPALIGEYRVVRGDGHLITSGRADDGQFPGIPPARHG